MSISDDNTNELDSYGVWVKNSSGNADLPEVNDNAAETADDSLDLPDFDNVDFSSDTVDDFSSDLDSTLSADELANITNGSGDITIEETPMDFDFDQEIPEENIEDGFVEPSDSIEESDFDIQEETPAEAAEEAPAEDSIDSVFDDVSFDDVPATDEIVTEETPAFDEPAEETVEETASDDGGEEEISLDDFMDGGFSDESVASGNNGFEEGKGPSVSESEEVSLDDFVDMSEFDAGPSSDAPKDDEIIEEGPIDMDISFDSSADTVETEENVSVENFDEEEEETAVTENKFETEEVSIDDFGADLPATDSESSVAPIDTEEVDLSDFGIDAEAEETPIVQDVEEAKNKETVVDYDLSVGDENTSAAPVVNEIKSDVIENAEPLPASEVSDAEPIQAAIAPGSEVVSSSLLQQIVNDLSGLKDEINQLKSNLEEIKAGEKLAKEEPVIDEVPVSDSGSSGGFFDLDDTDDTIALSGDELDNIFNSAQFSEVPAEDSTSEELPNEFVDTEVVPDSNPQLEDGAIEETFIEETSNENVDLPNEIEETNDFAQDDSIPEETDFSESAAIEEDIFDNTPVEEETISTEEFDVTNDNETLDEKIEENIGDELSSNEELSFDYENESLEEPSFGDEIAVDEGTDDIPDEISVPKSDDILVETSNDDFMDSVKDITEIEEESIPEAEASTDDVAFDTVDSILGDEAPVVEETEVPEEPVVEETAVSEEEIAPDFNEVDDLDSNLSDSNIDYLTTKDEDGAAEETNDTMNSDLKKDIKSVLLYMDQLLENLPEEKIVEFAKSDEFSTYKKLFTELGLS